MVVDQQDSRHRWSPTACGSSAWTVVPEPEVRTRRVPPTSSARCCMDASPRPDPVARPVAASSPTPSSVTSSSTCSPSLIRRTTRRAPEWRTALARASAAMRCSATSTAGVRRDVLGDVRLDVEAGRPDAISQCGQGGGQAELVQRGGSQAVGDRADLGHRLRDPVHGRAEQAVDGRLVAEVLGGLHLQAQPRQCRPDPVVQVASELQPLVLPRRHQGLAAPLQLPVELQRSDRRGHLVRDAPQHHLITRVQVLLSGTWPHVEPTHHLAAVTQLEGGRSPTGRRHRLSRRVGRCRRWSATPARRGAAASPRRCRTPPAGPGRRRGPTGSSRAPQRAGHREGVGAVPVEHAVHPGCQPLGERAARRRLSRPPRRRR